MCLKAIPEFEGYSIESKDGLIFSHKRQHFLKTNINRSGYPRTALYKNGVRKYVFNHIKNVEIHGDKFGNKIPFGANTLRELGLSIDHVNDNKLDPSGSNLELVTHIENCRRRDKREYSDNNSPIPDL